MFSSGTLTSCSSLIYPSGTSTNPYLPAASSFKHYDRMLFAYSNEWLTEEPIITDPMIILAFWRKLWSLVSTTTLKTSVSTYVYINPSCFPFLWISFLLILTFYINICFNRLPVELIISWFEHSCHRLEPNNYLLQSSTSRVDQYLNTPDTDLNQTNTWTGHLHWAQTSIWALAKCT